MNYFLMHMIIPSLAGAAVGLLARRLLPDRKTFLQQVALFHKRFDCYTAETLSIPPPSIVALRIALIREEFAELMEAMEKGDLLAIADADADLHYVLSGTMLAYGIPEDEVFTEVQRSNMDKAEPDGTVHRRDDGKILKALRWTPPNIEAILYRLDPHYATPRHVIISEDSNGM